MEVARADGESRIIQGLAEANIGGQGAVSLVQGESKKPETYAAAGRPVPPYSKAASVDDIIGEERKLIQRAKAEGFFWEATVVRGVISSAQESGGGSEHDVYIIGHAPHKLVVRSTINDSFGFAFRSPAQYLKRLEDFNRVFPGIQIRMIGVSENARGNGVIWTAQLFVEGREFSSDEILQRELFSRGWHRVDGPDSEYQHITYLHMASGVAMSDVHSGNVLENGGELYPVDVIIESLGR